MTTQTLTLTDFLLARIAEDEADANLCIHPYGKGVTPPTGYERHNEWPQGKAWYRDGWSSDEAPHLSRWSPARVLAECEAKRRIVDLHCKNDPNDCTPWGRRSDEPCDTLTALAAVYADHPGYREEWRP